MLTIRDRILALSEPAYGDFQRRLLPELPPESILGVRTPALRALARELKPAQAAQFLTALPHGCFEENQLHAFLLARERDPAACLAAVEAFLPYVDNWATCDQLSPPALGKRPEALMERIPVWLKSGHVYTVRFGLGMLQRWFLDDAFAPRFLDWAGQDLGEAYYVRMMQAWFFATALAKQPQAAEIWFQPGRLEEWTRHKAIQKSIDSRRIPEETKQRLRALR